MPVSRLLAAILGGEERRLHLRDLGQREVEPLLRAHGFVGAAVAVGGQGIEAGFVERLLALGLVAGAARGHRIHQHDGGSEDRPAHEERAAGESGELRHGSEPDEARVAIGFEKQPPLRKDAFEARVNPIMKSRQHRSVPFVVAR